MTGFAPTEALPRGGGEDGGKTKASPQDEHGERKGDDDNRGVNHSAGGGGGGSPFGLAAQADAAAREWAIDFGSAGGGGSACCDPSAGGEDAARHCAKGLARSQHWCPRESGFVITRTENHSRTRSHGLIGSAVAAHHREKRNPHYQQLRHSGPLPTRKLQLPGGGSQ